MSNQINSLHPHKAVFKVGSLDKQQQQQHPGTCCSSTSDLLNQKLYGWVWQSIFQQTLQEILMQPKFENN